MSHQRKARTKTTIRDIAKKASVSETAVSLAFRTGSRISEETRKRILRIATQLNYVPNLAARSLRFGDSRYIGVIVMDITNPFHAQMVRIADEIAEQRGYQLFIAESNWHPKKEEEAVSRMIGNRVQGILAFFCEGTTRSWLLMKENGIPHIAVDTYPSFYRGAFSTNDLRHSSRIAVSHLYDVGSRRLAFFSGSQAQKRFSAFVHLERGFVAASKTLGLPGSQASIVRAGLTVASGRDALLAHLSKAPQTDGIFCVNDLCAIGAIDAMKSLGITPGKDIAVVGIDNLEFSSLSSIALTSINEPHADVMRHATEELIRCLERREHPALQRRFKATLIPRDSTLLKKTL